MHMQSFGGASRCLLAALASALAFTGPGVVHATPDDARVPARSAWLRLPFIENQGQVDGRVAYYVPTSGMTVFVTREGEIVYAVRGRAADGSRGGGAPSGRLGWSVIETLVEGSPNPQGGEPSATGVSYFGGEGSRRTLSARPTYGRVDLGEVWTAINVSLHARPQGVEKVFTVRPGGSVDRIRVRVAGAQALAVAPDGTLVARTGLGDVSFTAPVAYQERDGVRHTVSIAYQRHGHDYGFTVGDYDRERPLVIDPLVRTILLGGTDLDLANALAMHPTTGDIYIAGSTFSSDFPGTAGGAQSVYGGGDSDAFIARLNSTLTTVIQVTYLGGTKDDAATALAIHPTTGEVYIAGSARSDFPGTVGGAQPTVAGFTDAFVARLNSGLTTLLQATFLGGSDFDNANALAIHPTTGEVYVAGFTASSDFPSTAGGAQPAPGGNGEAFVARLNSTLTSLLQASYLGGTDFEQARALAIHPTTGDVYVAGFTGSSDFPGTAGTVQPTYGGGTADAFVARLNANLTSPLGATYLGGGDFEQVNALAVHPTTGDVYATGVTGSSDFPGAAGGAQPAFAAGSGDAFVARLSSTLTSPMQSTFVGGSDFDSANAIAIRAASGEVYIAGRTLSTDFPATAGGAQPAHGAGGGSDAFIARLNAGLTTLSQATYLGTDGSEEATGVALSPTSCDVYVGGFTFPFVGEDRAPIVGDAFPVVGTRKDAFVALLTCLLGGEPDLTIAKAHSGNFSEGQIGATYTITVTNVGGLATDGTLVTVTDTLPAGLTATAISGPGWTCVLGTLICTRSDVLATGASYPSITVTVNVAPNAPASLINTATVAGGGDGVPGNNTATDPTTIAPEPDLAIAKSHSGNFSQGQSGATYTIIVTDVGLLATDGTKVTVTDTLPAGLIATAISGPGWTCTLATLTCTRVGGLASGASYPPITVTVTVAVNAAGVLVNTATVAGGGDTNPANNTATDSTTILPKADLTIAKSHSGTFSQGQSGATYTILVTNLGPVATIGSVSVTDTLPAGLTATALSGPGWTCALATLTCGRNDVLGIGASYPPITMTVTVAANAPGSLVNVATVGGGGDVNPANNTATDPATIVSGTRFAIAKSHTGNFFHGQIGATYTVLVTNAGAVATAGTVTVTDTVPAGLTATALSGPGWTCTLATLTCTRGDVLASGATYPPITVTVTVAADAPGSLINTATVVGGGDVSPRMATDPTTILTTPPIPALSPLAQVLFMMIVVVTGVVFLRRRVTSTSQPGERR